MAEEKQGRTEGTETQQMLESMKRQERMLRRSLWNQRIRTGIAVVVAVAIIGMVNTVNAAMHDVQILTGNASYAVSDLLNTVNALNLEETLSGIDQLVSDSSGLIQEGTDMIQSSSADIQKSLQAIAGLDVKGLNDSIKALEAITTSIGRFFGYKGE